MSAAQWRRAALAAAIALLIGTNSIEAVAQKKYDPGATDTEIKIGNIAPYSGAASAFAVIAKTEAAYFEKINAEGGINGRKVNFISYDDAYSPPKTVEQARKLVEGDEVLLIFNPQGTPQNSAIQKYLNAKKVPQLFVSSGASKWNNPKDFPWTMGFSPSFRGEAQIYAQYILREKPDARIAILYQNDDFGKDYVKGLKDGLGSKALSMIVAEENYEVTQPTIDSQIVKLKSSGADVFLDFTTPKFAAQAIKKMGESGWKPMHLLSSISVSIRSVIKPAGFENSQAIVSSAYLKDPTDPQWKTDAAMKAWNEFLNKYYPEANRTDFAVVNAYAAAQALERVLRQCGDDLTRDNVMKQAANIRDFELAGLLPGIKMNTSPSNFAPLSRMRLMRFKGETWELFGDLLSTDVGG
ncbi:MULTISPECIES: ABC transporter substrate-binding protein [unclassified Bradyrhizobium]|uniref:ABC transporter substrate-binding protein n=1 Tax=unclassified Bradyrhizobium TaxID=2631580 RepID=UPI00339A6229